MPCWRFVNPCRKRRRTRGRRVVVLYSGAIDSILLMGDMDQLMWLVGHEIGHHAIGFDVYKPRCLEEYHAWRWSLEAMAHNNLPITDSVRYRMARSLHYAVAKARRRGIKGVPAELVPYLERPTKPVKSGKSRGGEGRGGREM